MTDISIKAPAKINLFLKVLEKRADGYHNIYSWFQAVNLFDRLDFSKTETPGLKLTVEGSEQLPTDDSNLIIKAARGLFDNLSLPGGLEIKLDKNIPVAAGLGGGSADAAATIYAINRLFDLHLSNRVMMDIGLTVGSDVAFFFSNGSAEVTGRGDIIKELSLPQNYWIVLITPSLAISTADSYRRLKMDLTISKGDVKLSNCINFKELVRNIGDIGNDFEKVHFESYPVLGQIAALLSAAGADLIRMSGSGPTVFGLFENIPDIEVLQQASRGDWQVLISRPITLPAWD